MTTLTKFLTTLLVVLVLFLSSCSNNDDNISEVPTTSIETTEQLTAYLENLLQTNDVAGFSVAIAQENTITFQQSFGVANVATQRPFTNQTIINTASMSKTFVGAATAKAIAQGHFTLETNINELLPVEINNPKRPNSPIKIKHLVTHTSGIVDIPTAYIATNYYILPGEDLNTAGAQMLGNIGIQQGEAVDLDEYLSEILLEDGDVYNLDNFLDAEPGTQWMYSNTGTSLLSYIIEYVTGTSFDEYVQTYVLMPLQMAHSTYDIYDLDFINVATHYLDKNTPLPWYGNHGYAEGSMHTSSEDLKNYLIDMLRGVRGESSVLFSSEYYDLLFSEKLDSGIVPSSFAENHGLFWYMKNGNLMHGGNDLGVSSHLQLQQNGASGFFILSNMDGTFSANEPKWEQVKTLISNAIQEFISNN